MIITVNEEPALRKALARLLVRNHMENPSDARLAVWLLEEPAWTKAQCVWVTAVTKRRGARFQALVAKKEQTI